MPRIEPTTIENAPQSTKSTLEQIKQNLGMVPNIVGTLAKSPAALNGYLKLKEAMGTGTLGEKFGESIAIAVAKKSQCDYCTAAHNAMGKKAGVEDDERELNRNGKSNDPKVQAGIDLALAIVEDRGFISDDAFESAKSKLNEEEILEVAAITVFNLYTNYMNHIIETKVDFPEVQTTASAGA